MTVFLLWKNKEGGGNQEGETEEASVDRGAGDRNCVQAPEWPYFSKTAGRGLWRRSQQQLCAANGGWSILRKKGVPLNRKVAPESIRGASCSGNPFEFAAAGRSFSHN